MSDTIFMIDYKKLRPAVERVCRELPVKRLGIFGSVLTQEFGPQSDVDVLVVFDADVEVDLFEKYFELKERLEKVFGREVDLTVDKPFKNPIFRESVEKTRTIIYER
jgi:predicted nucleotidyltransferase